MKAKKKKIRKHDKQKRKRKQVTDSSARMGRLLHAAADFHRTDPLLLPFEKTEPKGWGWSLVQCGVLA